MADQVHTREPRPVWVLLLRRRAEVEGLQVPDRGGEALGGEVAFAGVAHHPLGEGEGHHRRPNEAERPAGG